MSKKIILYLAVLMIGSFLIISPALAVTIGLNPPSQDVPIGGPVYLNIGITGLGDYSPDSLSTFDLDLGYDAGILSFSSATFGDPVLGDQLDLFSLGSITGITPGLGTVNLFELSLDLPGDLDTLQAGSFTLATVTFNTLATGSSPLNLSINALGDTWGIPISANIINASANVVPEPAPFMLLLFLFLSFIVGLGIKNSSVPARLQNLFDL